MNYLEQAKQQYVTYIKATNPALLNAALAHQSRMGDGDTINMAPAPTTTKWYESAFDALKSIGGVVMQSKTQKQSDAAALNQILAQNKAAALQAQQQAVSVIQQREYADQIAQIKREQDDAARAQMDTILMVAGLALAALVGAKMAKII